MSPSHPEVRPLFEEFPAPSRDAWCEAASAELGGRPIEQKLGRRQLDGLPLEPIYTREGEAAVPHLGSRPGAPPYVRGARAEGHPWRVRAVIEESRPAAAAAHAASELAGGATEIELVPDAATRGELDPADPRSAGRTGDGGVSLASRADLDPIVATLAPAGHALVVKTGAAPLALAALTLASVAKNRASLASVTIAADPLGALAASGSSPASVGAAYDEIAALARWAAAREPAMKVVIASGAPYHEAGASADQELGLTVAAAVEYLRALIDRGVPAADAARRIGFSFPVGTKMFLETAKLRAARLVWGQVLTAYGCEDAIPALTIDAATSRRSETQFDPWVNMIRGTVEAFAAVLGGADSVAVAPFDHALRPGDAHSQRIARNTHALLRDESHLARVQDPAGGSYFVERLTDTLARRAWTVLQEIEKAGGLGTALATGAAQVMVATRGGERRKAAAKRSEPLIGVSKFPNLGEKPPAAPVCDRKALREERIAELAAARARLDGAALVEALAALANAAEPGARVDAAIAAADAGATIGELRAALRRDALAGTTVTPLAAERAAEGFERVRRASEKRLATSGARPRVLAAAVDSGKRAKAKLGFAREVLEVGGFEVVTRESLGDAAALAAARKESGAAALALSPLDDTEAGALAALVESVAAADPGTPLALIGRTITDDATRARTEALPQLFAGGDLVTALTNLARAMGVVP